MVRVYRLLDSIEGPGGGLPSFPATPAYLLDVGRPLPLPFPLPLTDPASELLAALLSKGELGGLKDERMG